MNSIYNYRTGKTKGHPLDAAADSKPAAAVPVPRVNAVQSMFMTWGWRVLVGVLVVGAFIVIVRVVISIGSSPGAAGLAGGKNPFEQQVRDPLVGR